MATRGITAGSGTATSELRLLLQEMMVELGDRWSLKLTVKLYVDDLTFAACGLPANIIHLMIEALDFEVDWLENILSMQVSAKKSQVLASKPSIAVAIANEITSKKHRRGAKASESFSASKLRNPLKSLDWVRNCFEIVFSKYRGPYTLGSVPPHSAPPAPVME